MAYIQVLNFNPSKMGKQKGWCLQNCRLGFGINRGKYASAKADMEAQKKNGTFHAGNPPKDVSVPVYCDTASVYEHIIVSHHGVVYSDGKQMSLSNFKVFGWGECCDGQRVVKVSSSPSTKGFLPSKGYWAKGDNDARIGRLAEFMLKTFPAYTSKKALGNLYGDNLIQAIKQFQRNTGLVADGMTGSITYEKLKKYGFKG